MRDRTRGNKPFVTRLRLLLTAGAVLCLTAAPASGQEMVAPDAVLDILDESCAFSGCHVGPAAKGDLDLSEEAVLANVINVKSGVAPQFLRVKPGDPQGSYLIMKILGSAGIKGERMPRGASALPADQIKVLADWIAAMPASTPQPVMEKPYADGFPGWSIPNLPTPATVPSGGFMYRIAHRFNSKVSEGFDQLFGLDGGASMMTQVAFPIGNDLSLSFERSGINATYEAAAKFRFLREKTDGSVPVSAAVYAGVDWQSVEGLVGPAGASLGRTDGERFSLFAQLPVSKQLGSSLAIAAVPGILLNGNTGVDGEAAIVTLGFAGQVNITKKYAFFAEVVPIMAGADDAATLGVLSTNSTGNPLFHDTFTAGLQIDIGGHVFHIFVTNSLGNTTNQYMSGGNFDFLEGDMRLGFNIYRLLNYPFQ